MTDIDEKILDIFRENPGNYISGEDISRELNISRAALWKHIEKLKALGYDFQATPHLGYRLLSCPDRLFPQEIRHNLNTKILGSKIEYHKEIDSTNNLCFNLAEKGYPEGTLVVAEGQSKGKGRLSRSWISPIYEGIYFSLILKPDILPIEVPKITLVIAVGIASAIRDTTGLPALIRWPNDILINKNKVCGILTEMNAEADKVNFIIAGIGINVFTKISKLPEGASSLEAEGAHNISRCEILRRSLENLEKYYLIFKEKGFDEIVREWQNLSAILGQRIKVVCHEKKIEGQAAGLDSDGCLLIRTDNGFQQRVTAGDVTLLR